MNNILKIDLSRLEEDSYMEGLTSSPSWEKLEKYFRSSLILDFADQVHLSDIQEKDKVIETFLINLTSEEASHLRQSIKTSDFLDTLVRTLNKVSP